MVALHALYAAEWFFTLLFTAEYLVRLWVVKRPIRYATSFFGMIDLLSILRGKPPPQR